MGQLVLAGATFHDLSGLTLAQQVQAIRRLVKQVCPDIVHAALFDAEVPAHMAVLGTRVPLVVTWANTPVRSAGEDTASWKLLAVHGLQVLLAHLPKVRFHAVTLGVATTQRRWLGVRASRVRVAERGRNASEFPRVVPAQRAAARERLGLSVTDLVILNIGRQEPQKGQVELIRAFDAVLKRLPSAKLLIAGRLGRASEQVNRAREASICPDAVHLLGHRDDIVDLLRASDAVVCASHREGAAGALIEAMAVGVPIVSVRLEGLDGILEDGKNARFVGRDCLGTAIVEALTDREGSALLADRARVLFEERFTIQGAARQLLEMYRWAVA
ncbi:MAG: glycosyltransferase family 4 protein [Microthrixaceae bacterium]|nr:glycosyltransferase family 4 protein [Microthrixaceae bacterium]